MVYPVTGHCIGRSVRPLEQMLFVVAFLTMLSVRFCMRKMLIPIICPIQADSPSTNCDGTCAPALKLREELKEAADVAKRELEEMRMEKDTAIKLLSKEK